MEGIQIRELETLRVGHVFRQLALFVSLVDFLLQSTVGFRVLHEEVHNGAERDARGVATSKSTYIYV